MPVLLHVQCPVSVVVIRVVPSPLRVHVAMGVPLLSGVTVSVQLDLLQPVPSGLKVQGSGSPISFMIPNSVGGRMRVSWGSPLALPAGAGGHSPVTGLLGHPRQCLLPGRGAGAPGGQCPGRSCPASPCPSPCRKPPGGGKVRFSTCVPESAVFANKSFWLWRSREGLGCPGWARLSRSRAQQRGRSGLWKHGSCLPLTVLVFCFLGKSLLLPWGF